MKIRCIKHVFEIGFHYEANNNSELTLKLSSEWKPKLSWREELALYVC